MLSGAVVQTKGPGTAAVFVEVARGGAYERGYQRGRAVPDVVAGHVAGAVVLHRQPRPDATGRLDLRRLVEREDGSCASGGRGSDRAERDAAVGGHCANRAVRLLAGRLRKARCDHALNRRRRRARQTGSPELVVRRTVAPGFDAAPSPALDAGLRYRAWRINFALPQWSAPVGMIRARHPRSGGVLRSGAVRFSRLPVRSPGLIPAPTRAQAASCHQGPIDGIL